jgi:NADH dehydrogenase FAD-containing subunit
MKVVIIGGGFCGARAAMLLEKKTDWEIVLVDKKTYFEFTPSIHKVIFDASHHKKIISPFRRFLRRTRIVNDVLTAVTPTEVVLENETIQFDYLLVASGIDYPIFLENKENVFTLKNGVEAAKIGEKVVASPKVLIIGGGLVGVEIAGELLTKTIGKELVVVHPFDKLLERNPQKASDYARKFLEKHGAKIVFGEKVVKHEGNKFITDKGTEIEADVGLWCAGIKCNPWFMKDFPETVFSERRALNVNEYLQLQGFENIFVGGDINSVKEEKTAQNAERHAELIVKNMILKSESKQLVAHKPRSAPLVISLGDKRGIMTLPNGWTINGLFPGWLKHVIEWKALRPYRK